MTNSPAEVGDSQSSQTDSLLLRARQFLPGGTLHTFSQRPAGFPTFLDKPDFVVERARGPWIWDTQGQRLLDLILGGGSILLGHAHPAVVSAVQSQIELGTNYSHISTPVVRLAADVVSSIPSVEKVRFFNSGTESMMYALRIVRAHTGKERILKLNGAYHGCLDDLLFDTSYGPVRSESGDTITGDSPGISSRGEGQVISVPDNDLDALRQSVISHQQELAAIIIEPVMRGIRPVPGYLEGVCEIARTNGVPLIFDEVITGFRLALGGAQEFYGVSADLTVLGKALGAGFPIGAVGGSEEFMAWLDTGQPDGKRILAEGSTYGNAISATSALANLQQLRHPGVYAQLHDTGELIVEKLRELFIRHGFVPQFTGLGPLVEFYFGEEPLISYAAAQLSDQRIKRILAQKLRGRGVFGGGGRYNVCLSHGEKEVDVLIEAVGDILANDVNSG